MGICSNHLGYLCHKRLLFLWVIILYCSRWLSRGERLNGRKCITICSACSTVWCLICKWCAILGVSDCVPPFSVAREPGRARSSLRMWPVKRLIHLQSLQNKGPKKWSMSSAGTIYFHQEYEGEAMFEGSMCCEPFRQKGLRYLYVIQNQRRYLKSVITTHLHPPADSLLLS